MSHLFFQQLQQTEPAKVDNDFWLLERLSPPTSENDNIDSLIDLTIQNLKYEHIKSITLPLSLTNNFLELTGLRLGHHIRLTKDFAGKDAEIIFYGVLPFEKVLQLPLGNIFLTPKVHYVNILKYSFSKIKESIKSRSINPTGNVLDRYLERVSIQPSDNYSSHHTTANEWALYRYSEILEESTEENLKNLQEKVKKLDYLKSLHFKYHATKFAKEKIRQNKDTYTPNFPDLAGKKIALIDDEAKKGWANFYGHIASKANSQLEVFNFLKGEERATLKKKIECWCKNLINAKESVDIFIIDLRLHDSDFNSNSEFDLLGKEIAEFIWKENKGIQIIISSASDKLSSYQNLLLTGAHIFPVKESPEKESTREGTKKSIIAISDTLRDVKKKVFLADLVRKIKFLDSIAVDGVSNDFYHSNFGENGLLNQILELIVINPFHQNIVNQCILLCWQVLETYVKDGGVVKSEGYQTKVLVKNKFEVAYFIKDEKPPRYETCFRFKKAYFELTKTEELIDIKKYDRLDVSSTSRKDGLEPLRDTELMKLIAILILRHDIPSTTIKKLLELKIFRNNVLAHSNNNVNFQNWIIRADKDLLELIDLFHNMFAQPPLRKNISE